MFQFKAIEKTERPKYKISWDYFLSRRFCGEDNIAIDLSTNVEDADKMDIKNQAESSRLYLPGRILHICENGSWWRDKENFTKIVLSQNMFKHHLPNKMTKALRNAEKNINKIKSNS